MNAPSSPTRDLARFVADARFEALPPNVVEQAKKLTLNLIGVAFLGSRTDAAPFFQQTFRRFGESSEATVFARPAARASAGVATMTNAAFAHQIELADAVPGAFVHASTAVVPAALAVGERERASGKDLLRAVALGCEALSRFGYSLDPFKHGERGAETWFTPTLLSPFGSSTATALLLGADGDTLHHAWGIAANLCPAASHPAFREGGSSRGALMGVGCGNGVLAADMANAGISGMDDICGGWLAVLKDEIQLERLTDGLGVRYEIERVLFKFFAVVGPMLPPLEAIFAILDQQPIRPEDVELIEAECYRATMWFNKVVTPSSPEAARGSLAFCLATAIVCGTRTAMLHEAFTIEAIHDERRLALARKVKAKLNETYDSVPYRRGSAKARVRIHLRDGRVFDREVDRELIPRTYRPTREHIAEQFRGGTAAALDSATANAVVEAVWRLETLSDVRELSALIARDPASRRRREVL